MAIFDTLTYARKLESAGVSPEQAEIHAESLRTLIENNLATKRDLADLNTSLRHDLADLKATTQHELADFRLATQADLREMEQRVTAGMDSRLAELDHKIELVRRDVVIKLGGIVVAGFTLMAALLAVLIAMIQMR